MRMLRAPRPCCLGFSTSVARRMAPAQVPKVGLAWTNCLSFSNPASPSSFRNVPDSPPGMTKPSIESSCSGFLTSTTSAPSSSSRRRCASKSPWRARTPILMGFMILTDGRVGLGCEDLHHGGHGGAQRRIRRCGCVLIGGLEVPEERKSAASGRGRTLHIVPTPHCRPHHRPHHRDVGGYQGSKQS